MNQVEQQASGRALTRDVDEYIKMRRGTIGAYPAIAITECVSGVQLPESVFRNDSLQECMRVSAELCLL